MKQANPLEFILPWNVLLLKQMPKWFFKRFLFFADGTNSNVNPGKIKTITVGSLKFGRPSLSRLLTPGIQINSDRRQKYPPRLNKARWSPLIKLVKEWIAKTPKNIVDICRFGKVQVYFEKAKKFWKKLPLVSKLLRLLFSKCQQKWEICLAFTEYVNLCRYFLPKYRDFIPKICHKCNDE